MGKDLGVNLRDNPDLLLATNSSLGWKSAIYYWAKGLDFGCVGPWLKGPTCPAAAAADDLKSVTRRLNPSECVPIITGSDNAGWVQQVIRINTVNDVREVFGLPPLDQDKAWCEAP